VNDRRIRARRIYELQQGEYHNARAENPFQHLFHSMKTDAQEIGKVPAGCKLQFIHPIDFQRQCLTSAS
jgi:hypothetical protein